jgi:hypothetical protein
VRKSDEDGSKHDCQNDGSAPNELRKRIGDAIVECANSGIGSLSDFQNAGSKVLEEILRPPKANWLGLGRLFKSD